MSRWTDPLIRVHTGGALGRHMGPKQALRTIKRLEAEERAADTEATQVAGSEPQS